jgi:hypothetical protein
MGIKEKTYAYKSFRQCLLLCRAMRTPLTSDAHFFTKRRGAYSKERARSFIK